MITWRPIEEAPKDGTEVLLFATKHGDVALGRWERVGGYWWTSTAAGTTVFTHFSEINPPRIVHQVGQGIDEGTVRRVRSAMDGAIRKWNEGDGAFNRLVPLAPARAARSEPRAEGPWDLPEDTEDK